MVDNSFNMTDFPPDVSHKNTFIKMTLSQSYDRAIFTQFWVSMYFTHSNNFLRSDIPAEVSEAECEFTTVGPRVLLSSNIFTIQWAPVVGCVFTMWAVQHNNVTALMTKHVLRHVALQNRSLTERTRLFRTRFTRFLAPMRRQHVFLFRPVDTYSILL